MNIFEWTLWGLGCATFLIALSLITSGRVMGRAALLFAVCAAAALMLTLFTNLSKLHLLWMLPVALALSTALGAWLGLVMMRRGLKQVASNPDIRKMMHEAWKNSDEGKGAGKETEILNHPPFPALTWTEYDWWEGTARLPAWAGFQSRGGAYGGEDSDRPSDGTAKISVTPHDAQENRIPSEAQCRGFQFQVEHGDEVVTSVLKALEPFYKDLKSKWDLPDEPLPDIASPQDFKNMIGLHQIHVHPYLRDGLCYVGLEFGCMWDEEHGLGVMLHGARVVDIGEADASFAWQPDEAQDP